MLKEVTEEAKQTKKAKKPSARGGRGSKKMEEGATKQTSKKRKTKAEGGWDRSKFTLIVFNCALIPTAEETVENDVPPPKKPKAPAQSDQTNGTEAVEGKKIDITNDQCDISFKQCVLFRTETDRAVDPVPVETQPPPPKTKQVKKTKVGVKTDHVEDVSNLPPVSHPSHGSTPGQVDHMITLLS